MPITGTTIALVLLALAVFGTLLLSLVLYYHWIRYGTGILGTFLIMVSYALGTAVLVLAALGVFAQL